MPLGIGPLELAIILLIVLVIFGPKRLPGLGRSLGAGMREFKDSITGKSKGEDEEEGPATTDPAGLPAGKQPQGTKPDEATRAFGRHD